ncbi:MAG: sulfite exporter TauE/SafE family protein [Woeseia sp.]
MITDPTFYLAAVAAVLLFGIAKGGFGGGLGVIAVPLMALAVSPVQAAAILLPILCLMDLVSLWAYRGRWVLAELRLLLPASMLGIGIGTWMFGSMSPAVIRLMLGILAVVFTLHHWLRTSGSDAPQKKFPPSAGLVAAVTAGFTSFIAHAGGPPISMYLLRRELDRTSFVATTVVFFAVVNYVKLIPYTWLGQLDGSNLYTSLVLAPLAPVGVGMGVWLHNRVSDRLFFRVAYTLLFVVGVKLIYDGVVELN